MSDDLETMAEEKFRAEIADAKDTDDAARITRTFYLDRIQELEAEVERLRAALGVLYDAGKKVSDMGAQTGPQWVQLTCALVPARQSLGDSNEDAPSC